MASSNLVEEQFINQKDDSAYGECMSGEGMLTSIRMDHEIIKYNIDRILGMSEDQERERVKLFKETVKIIAQHDVAEEVVFYPIVRNLGLKHIVDKGIQQTIEMEKLIYSMDKKYSSRIVDEESFKLQLCTLKDMLICHAIDLEEKQLIPVVEKELSFEDIQTMNSWFDKIKVQAPGKPHPDGPHVPAKSLAEGPVLSFVNRLGKRSTH